MVVLFVNPTSDAQNNQSVEGAKAMVCQTRNVSVNHNDTEILDIAEYWIAQEQALNHRRVTVDLIKYCGHIHEQQGKDIIQIPGVPKENKQCRQDQAHANVKYDQTDDRVNQRKEMATEPDPVNGGKNKEYNQRQTKIDQRRYIFGKEEHIFGNVDFCNNTAVGHQCVHTTGGGLLKIGVYQVSAKQIGGIVLHVAAKKMGKHQPHNQQCQQRRHDAPAHSENCALVFLLKVPLGKLRKQKSVLNQF